MQPNLASFCFWATRFFSRSTDGRLLVHEISLSSCRGCFFLICLVYFDTMHFRLLVRIPIFILMINAFSSSAGVRECKVSGLAAFWALSGVVETCFPLAIWPFECFAKRREVIAKRFEQLRLYKNAAPMPWPLALLCKWMKFAKIFRRVKSRRSAIKKSKFNICTSLNDKQQPLKSLREQKVRGDVRNSLKHFYARSQFKYLHKISVLLLLCL